MKLSIFILVVVSTLISRQAPAQDGGSQSALLKIIAIQQAKLSSLEKKVEALSNAAPNSPTSSCAAIKAANPDSLDGNYTITNGAWSYRAYCDMTTDGGGWTLVDSIGPDGPYTIDERTVLTSKTPDPTPNQTAGRYLPFYNWTARPLLLCKSSITSNPGVGPNWITLVPLGETALEYPTKTTTTKVTLNTWAGGNLNGHTKNAFFENYTYLGNTTTLLIGTWLEVTCACGKGIGIDVIPAAKGTCSTWVR